MHGERNLLPTLTAVLLIFNVGLVAYGGGESHSDTERNSKSPSKRRGKRRHVRVFTFDSCSQFPSSRLAPLFWLGRGSQFRRYRCGRSFRRCVCLSADKPSPCFSHTLMKVGPVSVGSSSSPPSIIIRRPAHVPSRTSLRTHQSSNNAREMDVDDAKQTSVSDDGTRADLDEEVAGGDGSGGLGKIRAVLFPPPTPDVDDWGIPPESQKPCDPEVEVDDHPIVRRTQFTNSLLPAGEACSFPYPQERS